MANVISQSVLSGELGKNQKILSGELTKNQKVLSGDFKEKIVTLARWGKITGDIYSQQDLIDLLEQYKSVVTSIVLEQNGYEVTINYIDENGESASITLPLSWALNRIRYVYRNGLAQDILGLVESSEQGSIPIPGGSITLTIPEYVVWVNDGTIDGRLIRLPTSDGLGGAIIALKDYLVNNYTSSNDLAPVALSGDINDLTQSEFFILNCGSSTEVIGG